VNRGQMRSLARRRLNDVSADQWQDDADINGLLDTAAAWVQGKVLIFNPDALVYIDRTDIAAGVWDYKKPAGLWRFTEVSIKDSTAASGYRVLAHRPYNEARNLTSSADTVYSELGQRICILPTPPASISQGLQLLWVPIVAMAVDTDVCDLHLVLHDTIVDKAVLLGVGETQDGDERIRKRIDDGLAQIPLCYAHSGENPRFQIDARLIGRTR
jgi:hypothetical protein